MNLYDKSFDEDINKDSFELYHRDDNIHDEKFNTKQVSYFSDALSRFAKNKSSLVAFVILAFIIIMSILVPAISTKNISTSMTDIKYLTPRVPGIEKLGIMDGTRKRKDQTYDIDTKIPYGYTEEDIVGGLDNIKYYTIKTSTPTKDLVGGQASLSLDKINTSAAYTTTNTYSVDLKQNVVFDFKVTDTTITDYVSGKYVPILVYKDNDTNFVIPLDSVKQGKFEKSYNVGDIFKNSSYYTGKNDFVELRFGILLEAMPTQSSVQVEKMNISIDDEQLVYGDVYNLCGDTKDKTEKDDSSTTTTTPDEENPYKSDIKTKWTYVGTNYNYGTATESADKISAKVSLVNGVLPVCSFKYDTYYKAFKVRALTSPIDINDFMRLYVKTGLCEFDGTVESFKVLSEDCPIVRVTGITSSVPGPKGELYSMVKCDVKYDKYLGFDTEPNFLFGTDGSGKDLHKELWRGAGVSLLLGFIVAAINIIIGIIWGAVSGYYGGTVDLVMQRFTEILGGVPWIVVMTLVILKIGSSLFSLGLALVLTGWIGTSDITRSQFYRYKGREYVLAARTLGAKDSRLIFTHILPNSLGPVVTRSILMIPSTIFIESTISYLGLGLKSGYSIGILLSNAQALLQDYPYLTIYPAVIVSVLMICFNLFGNGLRDALNPALRGAE